MCRHYIISLLICHLHLSSILSTTSDYTLRALPPISAEYRSTADKITSAFLGDPSFFAYNGKKCGPLFHGFAPMLFLVLLLLAHLYRSTYNNVIILCR